jgi:non-ribosomal peptide synthetase-like protein
VVGEQSLTYTQFDRLTSEVADRLRAVGAGPGERVGVRIASGTQELYAAILAVMKSGAAYVPVDADDSDDRIRQVFDLADVCAVITDDLEITTFGSGRAEAPAVDARDDAWIIFTSGTTGTPKGVAVSHASATAFVLAEQCLWRIDPADRVLAGLSVSFDASCEEMWSAWANGAALVPAPRSVVRSGVDLGDWLAERAVTVVSTVPTLATLWTDDVLDGIRLLILGGEALPEELGSRLAQRCEVWNTYGPTEATVVSTATRVRPGEPITIGHPLEGWLTAVVDEQGRPIPDGDTGELVIAGVGLARYLDDSLDRERFAAMPSLGWKRAYRSGDIVRSTAAGYVFVGRRDDQVKIGGRRIEIGEVDAHLTSYPGVAAAAATVRESATGNKVLVGYVVPAPGARPVPEEVSAYVAARLSGGVAPLILLTEGLPMKASGKVDRMALPWPPPVLGVSASDLPADLVWLADRWQEQLGPLPITAESDFFALGGTSVAAAKLVSVLRERYPSAAVADIYHHRRLDQLAVRLTSLGEGTMAGESRLVDLTRLGGPSRLIGLLVVLALGSLSWVLMTLGYDALFSPRDVQAPLWLLVALWGVFGSLPGRVTITAVLRRILLRGIVAGRYRRGSWTAWRLWFLDTLGAAYHLDHLAGVPWAARMARWGGVDVATSAHLGTMPPPSSLVSIGAGATIEKEVELRGWYAEGTEVVVAPIVIGAGARVAQRTMILPGVVIGAGAEIDVASVVCGDVPPGERWSGSPATADGVAGDLWADRPPLDTRGSGRLAFALVGVVRELVPLLALAPDLVWLAVQGSGHIGGVRGLIFASLPAMAITYVVIRALLTAILVRAASRWIGPGVIRNDSPAAAAMWLNDALMGDAMTALFPLFATSFTRSWLRLAGIRIGEGTEISTSTGLSHLVTYGSSSFSTDDVVFVTTRSRDGWTEIAPITVGSRSFLGNGAILRGGTTVGNDCLVGLQTVSPYAMPDGTTWLGTPALEVPRIPLDVDPARTTNPSRRLRRHRRAFDLLRIILPAVVVGYLAIGFDALLALASRGGIAAMFLAAPMIALALGTAGCALTIIAKWLLIGRYRVSSHPFFSSFVWRDELLNSLQEQVAGAWLLQRATGTPVLNGYLRLMGARIGRGAYVDTIAITEFDQVNVGTGAAINHHACIQTHLFHDRVMQIGPSHVGVGSTMAPRTAVLLDTVVGDDTHLGMRSVLLRGEELPSGTRWIGVPVTAAPALRSDLMTQPGA